MCGIYGSINKFDESVVEDKIKKIVFRGPEYTGILKINDRSYFAHNRLAIIDLDNRSNQPFVYKHLTIVFNGEIYNFNEIKINLLSLGFEFTTNSDTEVICVAYFAYGKNCLDHFNGMFSFVVYDDKEKSFFAARDRLGKKPFFYIYDKVNSSFEFASQLSPLISKNKLTIDWDKVSEYFFWGYNQDPNTPFNEVNKLPAGHYLVFDLKSNDLIISKYWDINHRLDINEPIENNYNNAKDKLKEIITDAVKIRMIADVPIGVFLSGGIDSSLIASIAQDSTSNNIKTFSISFLEDKYDEGKYAKKVANHLGTEHHEFYCDFEEAINFINNFEDFFDEPFADMSSIPTLLLSKKTKEKVTVALSGDGGDEIFAGYQRYAWMNNVKPIYNYFPKTVRSSINAITSLIPNYKINLLGQGINQNNLFELYCKMVGTLKPDVFTFDQNKIFKGVENYWDFKSDKLTNQMTDFDIKTYLNNDINTKVDRSSMRFSLETRAPLMDYRVLKFAKKLPLNYKINKGIQKRILKDILYEYVPAEYFDRPKAGFAMPLKEWFRTELKEMLLDTITEKNLNKIPVLSNKEVMNLVSEHLDGAGNHALELWKIIVWIKFYNKHIENAV